MKFIFEFVFYLQKSLTEKDVKNKYGAS